MNAIRLSLVLLAVTIVLSGPARTALGFDKDLRITGGLGFSFADRQDTGSDDGSGTGALAEVELLLKVSSFFSPRAYGGVILTWPDRNSCGTFVQPCNVSSRLAFPEPSCT